jgi:hypothetical protein
MLELVSDHRVAVTIAVLVTALATTTAQLLAARRRKLAPARKVQVPA